MLSRSRSRVELWLLRQTGRVSIKGLAVAVVDFFFDDVEVEGIDRVPPESPLILAANHHSGLMDAMMLYALSPRDIRAVGKSTLWKIWPLRPFLAAAKVIPIHRRTDGGGDNSNSFTAVTDALLEQGVVAIFVEGTSHDKPGLEPVKTGAARMALDAVDAGADLKIVPVGLIFEDRDRFRSDALARFGEPIDVAADFAGFTSADREVVRDLTDRIEAGLRTVAPTWESPTVRAAARSQAIDSLAVGATLGQIEAEAERLARDDGEVLGPPDASLVGRDGEIQLMIPPGEIDPTATAVLWPVALAGKILNLPPYLVVMSMSQRLHRNIRATMKVIGAMLLFPVWWAGIAVVAAWFGASWQVALAIAAGVAVLGVIAARELPVARAELRTLKVLRQRGDPEGL